MTDTAAAYAALKAQFLSPANTNFWLLGNALDSMVDYLQTLPAGDTADDSPITAEDIGNKFVASLYSRCWYDDDGWWVIATLKAYVGAQQLGWDPGVLQVLQNMTWTRFSSNAPYVWGKSSTNAPYNVLQPLVQGGVWNSGWPLSPCCGTCDPTEGASLSGIQNTVTNALFLTSASRRALAFGQYADQTLADQQYQFLTTWFDGPAPTSNSPSVIQPLLRPCTDGVVVRERVTAYDSSLPVGGYDPDMAWLGDQGIIIGGILAQMMLAPEAGRDVFRTQIENILKGVKSYLCPNGTLLNWPGSVAPGNDPGDYSTGSGVFFRYLRTAWLSDDLLAGSMRTEGWPLIVSQNQTPTNYGDQLIYATNVLAAALANETMNP